MYFMRKNMYDSVILQMTWFKGRIRCFRQILHNVGRRQVISSIVGAKCSTKMQWSTNVKPDRAEATHFYFSAPRCKKKRIFSKNVKACHYSTPVSLLETPPGAGIMLLPMSLSSTGHGGHYDTKYSLFGDITSGIRGRNNLRGIV